MNLSQSTALIILLIVTFLWGSWFQVVKHTGDYPIYALLSWLYVFSIFIVWGSIALLHKQMVPDGVFHEIASDIPRTLFVLLCVVPVEDCVQAYNIWARNLGLIR